MTNGARCKHQNKSRIFMAKASFNKKTYHQQIELKFKEEASKVLHVQNSFVWSSCLHRASMVIKHFIIQVMHKV